MDHPVHLRGHVFRVASVNGMPLARPLPKDVSLVPANGGALTWIFDTNSRAGRLLLHCHNEIHMMDGMMTEVE
jgi:multicopper oxidase